MIFFSLPIIKLILFAFLLINYIDDSDQVNCLVIPISCIEANSCSGTQEIKEHLEILTTYIGYVFDGDHQYLDLRLRRYSQ